MKRYLILLLVICSGSFFQKIYAQNPYAVLEKNRNIAVKNLHHELNTSKDTLLLKSDFRIDRVYSINKDIKREIDTIIFADNYNVPLVNLTKGKHVFVVEQNRKKIVFVIRVLRDYILPKTEGTKVVTSNKD